MKKEVFVNNLEELKNVERNMYPRNIQEILDNEENNGMIPVVDLAPHLFEGDKKILNKYFRYNNHDLEVFHLPELTKEEYDLYVSLNKVKEDSKEFSKASSYYKNKAQKWVVARDLGIPEKLISFKDYNRDDLYYEFSDFYESVRYAEEDAYREDNNSKEITSKELYIEMCSRKRSLDIELYK